MTEGIPRGTKVLAKWTGEAAGYYHQKNSDGSHEFCQAPFGSSGFLYVPENAEIQVLFHDEPGIGSVVLDIDGDAWQRRAIGNDLRASWYCCDPAVEFGAKTWDEINEDFGPIQIVVNR